MINLVKSIEIKKSIFIKNEHNIKQRFYEITINLVELEKIINYFDVTSKYIKWTLRRNFIESLVKTIAKQIKHEQRLDLNKTIKRIIDSDKKVKEDAGNPEEDEKLFMNNKPKNKAEDEEDEKSDEDEEENEEADNEEDPLPEEDKEQNQEQSENEEMNVDDDKKKQEDERNFSHESTYASDIEFNEQESTLTFNLKFPLLQKGILLKNILDNTLKKLNFISVDGIKKCHLLANKNKSTGLEELSLQFEGINFQEVFKYDEYININKISTNDIGAVLRIYGIEACKNMIVKEIKNVFQSYSISVDTRHLGLIADYMTYQGYYRSFNRVGMELSSSPFLKMTFETSMNYIVQCCSAKDYDNARSPSSQIVLGLVPRVGTGMFSVLNAANQ